MLTKILDKAIDILEKAHIVIVEYEDIPEEPNPQKMADQDSLFQNRAYGTFSFKIIQYFQKKTKDSTI